MKSDRGQETHAGFTLVELMVAVAIIGIVAAISVPSLSRARAAALESAAVGLLRSVQSGQNAFAASCGEGFFAPSMLWLTRSPAGGGESFISPELDTNTLTRGGYRVRFRRGPLVDSTVSCNGVPQGRAVATYFLAADPTPADGRRHFATNQDGTLYESIERMPITLHGAPPWPAKPVE